MGKPRLTLDKVSFSYNHILLLNHITHQFKFSWTALVGANGSGKSTLLKIIAGVLAPYGGTLQACGRLVVCDQKISFCHEQVKSFFDDLSGWNLKLRDAMGINSDWCEENVRSHLSLGEQKRLQVALALKERPDILILDEPTNHLDMESQQILMDNLQKFQGIGILVSHQRAFMDQLCTETLVLKDGHLISYAGNYSFSREMRDASASRDFKVHQKIKREMNKIDREYKRRKSEAQKADKKRSKRKLDKKDSDGRERINRAKLTGRDGHAGKLQAQLKSRHDQLSSRLEENRFAKEGNRSLYVSSSFSRKNQLLSWDSLTLQMGDKKELHIPSHSILSKDRIGLMGGNGFGKTSTCKFLMEKLKGHTTPYLYMPQAITEAMGIKLLKKFKGMCSQEKGQVLSLVKRLGSCPEAVLHSDFLSPGELRKFWLILGIVSLRPQIIFMDEPSNHLDIASIETLEETLQNMECALFIISHDEYLIKNTTQSHWTIEPETKGESLSWGDKQSYVLRIKAGLERV